ncbi:hypothetical protein DPMN_091584 [Dreissena polymorpha]|uniref:Uncharacterized protein n=1 Tax=Dreissena polymorpha TaxID=45954 RepID=A0A9D4KZS7_DREPO|nr:hypothetical protein DPMN_091584 [Dreissena polymorpha]
MYECLVLKHLQVYERAQIASSKSTADTLRFQPASDKTVSFIDILVPDSWDWRTKGAVTPVREYGPLDAFSYAAGGMALKINFV